MIDLTKKYRWKSSGREIIILLIKGKNLYFHNQNEEFIPQHVNTDRFFTSFELIPELTFNDIECGKKFRFNMTTYTKIWDGELGRYKGMSSHYCTIPILYHTVVSHSN